MRKNCSLFSGCSLQNIRFFVWGFNLSGLYSDGCNFLFLKEKIKNNRESLNSLFRIRD